MLYPCSHTTALCTRYVLGGLQAVNRDNNCSIALVDEIGFLPYDTISSFYVVVLSDTGGLQSKGLTTGRLNGIAL